MAWDTARGKLRMRTPYAGGYNVDYEKIVHDGVNESSVYSSAILMAKEEGYVTFLLRLTDAELEPGELLHIRLQGNPEKATVLAENKIIEGEDIWFTYDGEFFSQPGVWEPEEWYSIQFDMGTFPAVQVRLEFYKEGFIVSKELTFDLVVIR